MAGIPVLSVTAMELVKGDVILGPTIQQDEAVNDVKLIMKGSKFVVFLGLSSGQINYSATVSPNEMFYIRPTEQIR